MIFFSILIPGDRPTWRTGTARIARAAGPTGDQRGQGSPRHQGGGGKCGCPPQGTLRPKQPYKSHLERPTPNFAQFPARRGLRKGPYHPPPNNVLIMLLRSLFGLATGLGSDSPSSCSPHPAYDFAVRGSPRPPPHP